MENVEGKGLLLSPVALADVLRHAAAEVERGASWEGSITWETPEAPDSERPDRPEPDGRLEVLAFFRTGQDMGQGGAHVIQDSGNGMPGSPA